MTGLVILVAFLSGVIVTALVGSTVRRAKPASDTPGPYQALIETALARSTADDFAGASAALRQAIEASSQDASLSLLFGDVLRRGGDVARAERVVEVLAARQDLSNEVRSALLLLRGRLLEETDSADEALACYEQAAGALPRAPAPLIALERLLSRLNRWPEAIAASLKLQKLVPDRGKLVTARRRVLYARELLAEARAEEALKQAQVALSEVPNLAAAILTRGDALYQLGQRTQAREAWLEAAREAPHVTALSLDRLEGTGSTGDREIARRFAQDMIEREATGITSWRLYAWMADDALRRKDVGEARAWVERVADSQPRSATAQRLRARLAHSEDGERAQRSASLMKTWAAERLWWDAWRCTRCGHAMDEFDWRCPSCQAWESLV